MPKVTHRHDSTHYSIRLQSNNLGIIMIDRYPKLLYLPSLLISVVYGYAVIAIFTSDYWSLETLSWSFIMLVPYALGVLAITFAPPERRNSLTSAIVLPWFACIAFYLIAIVFTLGMLLCIIISVPVFFVPASLGGVTVYSIRQRKQLGIIVAILAMISPFAISPAEAQIETVPQYVKTITTIDIDAPVDVVWNEIKTVRPITAEEHRFDWLHQVGLPRPVAATLDHEGIGGVRDATFENGLRFDETITEWEHHQRIRFTIVETSDTLLPPPLDLIDGERFDVVEGLYEIEPLADGTVRLHLSSDHYLNTNFNHYGAIWTDYIMHDLQMYILEVVKARAESSTNQ